MVEDANIKRIHSEKLYADANHQVCLLNSIIWYKICFWQYSADFAALGHSVIQDPVVLIKTLTFHSTC